MIARADAPHAALYETDAVRNHFERHASSYWLGELCSLGLLARWRRLCLARLTVVRPGTVCDAMSGPGSNLPLLRRRFGGAALIAADHSEAMQAMARRTARRHGLAGVQFLQTDFLANPISDGSVDALVCSFGLKTLSETQQYALARQVKRMLRPGGQFSLVELSRPTHGLLRRGVRSYMAYGPGAANWLCGHPHGAHGLLPAYLDRFGDCRGVAALFGEAGLETHFYSADFGLATGIWGRNPNR